MRRYQFALLMLLLAGGELRLAAEDAFLPLWITAPNTSKMEARGTQPPVSTTEDAATADEALVVGDPNAAGKPDPAKAAADVKKKQAELKKAINGAYAGVFYNNNFAYLNNPLYDDWYPGDRLKQNRIGENWIYDLGGQYRMRHHSERNMRNGPGQAGGLTGNDDNFLLYRTRLFLNLKRKESVRIFAEFLDAESNYENFAPRAIEVNRADFLNLFGDFRLADLDDGDLWFRVGRQELLFGNQRLISPLDWANTRRNFEGLDVFWRGEDWNVDAFFTRPVVVNPYRFDSPDYGQDFMGAYANYKGRQNEQIDLYYLHYRNNSIPAAVAPSGIYYETTGARWQGSQDEWLWETEGAYQFGRNGDNSAHSAAFLVGGVGRKFDHDWKPTLWGYLDWSSGGNQLGKRQGFDHLFPLGHRYHGFMDFYARSNITTPNVLLEAQPHERLKCLLWYHYFFLSNPNDSPYNVNMSPYNGANRPASRDLGHEIDCLATIILNPRMDLQLGYSHFFAGQYYKTTPGVPFRGEADFFYTQAQWNF